MALPIVFNNTVYAANRVAADQDGVINNQFLNESISPSPYVLSGTVNNVGDAVSFTPTGMGASAFTGYATNFDNPGQIVFSLNPNGTGVAIIISNTALTQGQAETFTETNLGNYGDIALVVAGDNVVNAAEAATGMVSVTGTLPAALGSGDSVVVTIDGATYAATTSGTSFSVSAPVPNAAGNVTAHVVNNGGTAPSTGSQAYTFDTTAPATPAVPVLANDTGAPGDHITSDPTITFPTAASGDALLYSRDGGAYGTTAPAFATDGSADGNHTVSVEERDTAGNVSAASSLAFTLDTTVPAVAVTGVSGPTNVVDGHVVSGTGEAGTAVTLVGASPIGSTTVDGTGHWSLALPTDTSGGPSASYHLVASDTDAAGNIGTGTFDFALDFTPNEPLFGTVAHDASSPAGQAYEIVSGLLGTPADPLALETVLYGLTHGGSPQEAVQTVLDSSDYRAAHGVAEGMSAKDYVDGLYATVLGRAPDGPGEQNWISALGHGASQAEVALGFAVSPEHLQQTAGALSAGAFVPDLVASDVARFYEGIFGRAPDAGGLANWVAYVNGGHNDVDVAASFLGSAEYAQAHPMPISDDAFVTALYTNALGRAPEPAGLAYWDGQLASGASRAQVAVGVAESAESHLNNVGIIEAGYHLA